MNIIIWKLSCMVYGAGECQGHITLLMDILAITFGQTLQKKRFISGSLGRRFFLILFIITSYLLLSAYEGKLRASLITLDVEETVHNTEV